MVQFFGPPCTVNIHDLHVSPELYNLLLLPTAVQIKTVQRHSTVSCNHVEGTLLYSNLSQLSYSKLNLCWAKFPKGLRIELREICDRLNAFPDVKII